MNIHTHSVSLGMHRADARKLIESLGVVLRELTKVKNHTTLELMNLKNGSIAHAAMDARFKYLTEAFDNLTVLREALEKAKDL